MRIYERNLFDQEGWYRRLRDLLATVWAGLRFLRGKPGIQTAVAVCMSASGGVRLIKQALTYLAGDQLADGFEVVVEQ